MKGKKKENREANTKNSEERRRKKTFINILDTCEWTRRMEEEKKLRRWKRRR